MLSLLAAAALQWVILGPGGESVVRAVVEQLEAKCPVATVDGEARPLELRYPGGPGFPITICELRLPPAVKTATLRDLPLPLPKANPTRVAAFGDTGCRVKKDEAGVLTIQNCDNVAGQKDTDRWPFKQLAEAAAALSPDLVIHLGDIVYRKAPCPAGEPRCAATTAFGVSWDALKAELFEPAAALFAKAPWVVPRGNHETCDPGRPRDSQGGAAFFLLLDPHPLEARLKLVQLDPYLRSLQPGAIDDATAACKENYEPYVVPAGPALDLWVLDANLPDDVALDDDTAELYALQLKRLQVETAASGKDRAWLLSHRPFYGAYPGSRAKVGKKKGKTPIKELNVNLQRAFDLAGRPAEVDLVLSGHVHVFQSVVFESGKLPAQLVAGTGGSALDLQFAEVPELRNFEKRPYALAGVLPKKEKDREKSRGLTEVAFGFVLLERSGSEQWKAALIDPAGQQLIGCATPGRLRELRCQRVKAAGP